MLSSFSLPKQHRLLHPKQFSHVLKARQRFKQPAVIACVCPNQHAFARLGLGISKRHIAKSVDRNRIKRVIRERFRHQQDLQKLDIVVMSTADLQQLTNTEINQQLEQLWQNIKIWQSEE